MKRAMPENATTPRLPETCRPAVVPARHGILVAVSIGKGSVHALLRAHAMAEALGVQLHLVHVLPNAVMIDVFFSHRSSSIASSTSWQSATAIERIRVWAEAVLHIPITSEQVTVQTGNLLDVIGEVALDLDAMLVVVGGTVASDHRSNSKPVSWSRLPRTTGCPLLLARAPREDREIVAATDFRDDRFPAVMSAGAIASQLNCRLMIVHNVGRSRRARATSQFTAQSVARLERTVERRCIRLVELAGSLTPCAKVLVAVQDDAVQTILDAAGKRDADLLVIGAHMARSARFARYRSQGTADRLLESACRSVLVVPIDQDDVHVERIIRSFRSMQV